MEKIRLHYIDQLKGFAIILVVFGHIAEKSMGIEDSPFNFMYQSFHMPLFLFLSGIFVFSGIENFDWKDFIFFIKKKAIRILLPFLIVGGAYSIIVLHNFVSVYNGVFGGYWFLPAVFLCMLFSFFSCAISHRLTMMKPYVSDLLSFLFIFGIISIPWLLHLDIPYWLHALKGFPFFMFGMFYNKYSKLKQMICYNDILLTSSIILYILSSIVMICFDFHFIIITGFFAIIMFVNIFSKYETQIPNKLEMIGQYSLEIYVLHWFFLPNLNDIGKLIYGNDCFNGNLSVILLVCCIMSIPIIALCLFVSTIIKRSKLMRYLCFGIRQNK